MSVVELTVEIDDDLYERLQTVCWLHGISPEEYLRAFVQCATAEKVIHVPVDQILKRAISNCAAIKADE